MSTPITFFERLKAVITPTINQTLGFLALALALLAMAQSHTLLGRLGISSAAIDASQQQFHDRFDGILRSSVASHLALVTFWAAVGLIAYLICWSVYNLIIDARNHVTLATEYTNRGNWRGLTETIALKAVCAAGLVAAISFLWYGVSFWAALSGRVITHTDPSTVTGTIIAWLGLAAQLYLLLVLIQLAFTPWYRVQTFTDAQ